VPLATARTDEYRNCTATACRDCVPQPGDPFIPVRSGRLALAGWNTGALTRISRWRRQALVATDEALEVVDLLADSGLEGVVTWSLRLVGLLAVLAGISRWLFTEMGLLVVPGLLIAVGVVLLVAPSVLLALAELT